MRVALMTLIALALPPAATAADIRVEQDADYGCLISLSGQIDPGDSDRLRAALGEASRLPQFDGTIYVDADFPDGTPNIGVYRPLNLCLDSPGGTLPEAVALAELVHGRLGTVVRAGARCESACAIVFMAGSYSTETDIGLIVNRFLHVDGRLGFHAPSLTVPDGQYGADSVQQAYRVSVQATATIFRNLVKYRFPPSLAARMHATPATEMFYVTRVDQAARWGISILGIDRPSPITDAVIRNACANLYLSVYDRLTSDPDDWPPGTNLINTPVTREGRAGFAYQAFGMEAAGTCKGTIDDGTQDWTAAGGYWGDAPQIAQSVWADAGVRDAVPPVFFGMMQNFMAWPGALQLDALPRGGQARRVETPGRCVVFNSQDRLQDRERCTRTRQATPDGGMTDTHLWPSGARTVIEHDGPGLRLNGQKADMGYWPVETPQSGLPDCTRNPASGNTFCFQPD